MQRGPLGPGSRGSHKRRRPGATKEGGTEERGEGDEQGVVGKEPRRERRHAGRPLVIASIHEDTAEVRELARTLGLRLVLEVRQKRNRQHPATFLGRGKLSELKAQLDEWRSGRVPEEWRWAGSHWVPAKSRRAAWEKPSGNGGTAARQRSERGRQRDGDRLDEGESLMEETGQRDMILVLDEEVRPAVLFNVEERLGVEVWDRTRLILEIFSQHAHLREARLQVELAQLRYEVPMVHEAIHRKLRGERPGFMGGGEYAVADYEEYIKRRMRTIREELKRVRHDRAGRRKVRRGRFYQVSLAGYTNAGKSSLLEALTGADALQESSLFSTLGTMTRRLTVSRGNPERGDPLASYRRPILVTDTVGFIRALPSWLLEAFHATLEEIAVADVVVMVADVSDPPEELVEKIQVGMMELAHLDVTGPLVVALNKSDLVSKGELQERVELIGQETDLHSDWLVPVSARREEGLRDLVDYVNGILTPLVNYEIKVSGVEEGQRLLSRLYGWGEVQDVEYGDPLRARGACDPIYWNDLERESRELGAELARV